MGISQGGAVVSHHLVQFWQQRTEDAYREVVRLEQENASLKADVERLTDENVTLRVERMQDETGKRITYADYAKLKEDLEYVRKMRTEETLDLQEMSDWNNAMRARIKRLIEAGDMIVDGYLSGSVDGFNIGIMMWNDAKEDKQP